MAASSSEPEREPVAAALRRALAALAARLPSRPLRLVLGCSGGVDSTVLLHALAEARADFPLEPRVVHVHHGLLAQADAWVEAVRAQCTALGVPLQVAYVRVQPDGRGLEAAARSARLHALAAVPGDALVLAQHRDDQAETVLFRLLRGSGVAGLAAMRPIAPAPLAGAAAPWWLRPFLDLPKETLIAWARGRGLSWVEDPSNASADFTRNWLRGDILPRLEARLPGVRAVLARTAETMAEAQQGLNDLAALDDEQVRHPHGGWDLAEFFRLPDHRQKNLLRWAVMRLPALLPSQRRLEEGLRQAATHSGGVWRFPLGDAWLCARSGRLWVEAAPRGCDAAWRCG
ncbi:MAG: tRNA(Ile)-lysidine synthase [Tepidiphilus sp.]|nr:tRNA(Ile)-lysidine synthase [Tepidiphilus sp.]